MKTLLLAVALTVPSPADMTVIRRCIDNLSVQMYAFRDDKGGLWYGSPMVKGAPPMRLDKDALDQVCPDGPMHRTVEKGGDLMPYEIESQKNAVMECHRALIAAVRGKPFGVALDALNMITADLIINFLDENARPRILRQIDLTLRERVVALDKVKGYVGPM